MSLINKKADFREYIYILLMSIPLIWSFTGLLLYNHGRTEFITFCIIAIVSFIIKNKFKIKAKELNDVFFVRILLLTGCYLLIAKCFFDIRAIYLKLYICIGLLALICPRNILFALKKNFFVLIFFSSISSLLFVLFNFYYLRLGRGWVINPIPYSTIIATISILSLYYLFLYKNKSVKLLMFFSFLFTIPGLILGESRGVWVALVFGIISLFFIFKNKIFSKINILLILLILTGFLSLGMKFSGTINNRISFSKHEISLIEKGNMNSSFGLRLEMWKAALYIIPQAPFFGVAEEHYKYKQKLADDGIVSKNIVPFIHFHNGYLDLIVKYGFVTFFIIMFSFLFPFYMYIIKKDFAYQPAFLAFIIYSIASLTDVPLYHPQPFIFYFLIVFMTSFERERNIKPIV